MPKRRLAKKSPRLKKNQPPRLACSTKSTVLQRAALTYACVKVSGHHFRVQKIAKRQDNPRKFLVEF